MNDKGGLKQSEFFRTLFPGLPEMPVTHPVWDDAGLRVQNRVRGIERAISDGLVDAVWRDKP